MMTGAADSQPEIVQVIQSWYPMWKPPAERHGWLSCLCPFHDETRPSASVNYEKNAFNCHGCGMKGDIIALIRRKEGLSYGEAVKRAASLVDGGGKAVSQLPRRKSGRGVFGRSGTSGTRKTIWSRVREGPGPRPRCVPRDAEHSVPAPDSLRKMDDSHNPVPVPRSDVRTREVETPRREVRADSRPRRTTVQHGTDSPEPQPDCNHRRRTGRYHGHRGRCPVCFSPGSQVLETSLHPVVPRL